MNQKAIALEQPVDGVGQAPGDLLHPQSVRAGRYARNPDASSGQLDKEQNQEAPQSLSGPDFHCKRSAQLL